MSLFPIAGTKQLPYQRTLQQQQQEGEAPDAPGPAAWLSGNTSFRPGGGPSDSQQNPYGHYDSQGAFLRAAERYLEDSSSGEDDEDGGAPGGTLLGTAPVAAAAAPEHRISTLKGLDQPVDDAAKRENTDVHGAGGRGRSAGGGMGDASGRGRRALSPSSSPSRSGSSSNSGSSDGSRGHRSRKRKHRSGRRKDRRSRSRSRSRSRKDSSAKHSKKRKKARRDRDEEDEVEKIRRLECAAAAAGLAPREAAALAAAKPLLKGAAPQPGELYYDTRGDLQNLVYEALYGSNVASYHRVDPLGLARGARARRLLPGQVTLYGSTAGGAGAGVRLRYKSYGEDADADDEWAEEGAAGRGAAGRDPFGTRYFAGRTVALERSRRMKRVRMREEAVLAPGQGDRLAGGGGGGGGGGGSLVGADSGGGWLLSRVGGGPTTGRGPGTAAGVHDAGSSRLGLPLPAFLPLQDPAAAAALATAAAGGGRGGGVVDAAAAALAAAAVEGESTEEWVLRRTREFNVAVREAPQDVQLWLRFARFQDTVARLLSRRAADAAGGAAEKKISILQRALEHHPGHPAVLRALMGAVGAAVQPEQLLDRWEKLLRRTPGVPALWREYLAHRRAAFGSVKLALLQAAYGDALHALASERLHLARQQQQPQPPTTAATVSELDRELVRLVLELVELELGAGASEVAVARVQALLEFHCFAPGATDQGAAAAGAGGPYGGLTGAGGRALSPGALLRLFDNFWESGAARVGEEGALGWASWYRREHESLWLAHGGAGLAPGESAEDPETRRERERQQEEDQAGWTGWVELPSAPPPPLPAEEELPPLPPPDDGVGPPPPPSAEGADGEGSGAEGQREGRNEEEGEEEEGEVPEEEGDEFAGLTEEELMAQLGLRLDRQLEEMQQQGVPPAILRRWLRTEAARSARDWQPLRPQPASDAPCTDRDTDAAAQPPHDPQRVVLLEDIRDCIFPIEDPELRYSLVLGLLTLLGVPLAAAAAATTLAGGGGGACTIGVGCVPCTFLQLLPAQTALATCQQLVPWPGGPLAALYGGGNGSGGGDSGGGSYGACTGGGAWLCEDESRRLLVARVLKALLLRGPYSDEPQLCFAYLLVEGAAALKSQPNQPLNQPPQMPAVPRVGGLLLSRPERAREAARHVLSLPAHRNSLPMLGALAALEEAAGLPRAARKILDTALAAAVALPPTARTTLPLLVQQYAEAEWRRASAAAMAAAAGGGGGGTVTVAAAAQEGALRAHHVVRWFLSYGSSGGTISVPYVPYKAGGAGVTREELVAARRAFGELIPRLLSVQGGALDAPAAATLYLGGMFEVLTAHLFPTAAGGGGGGLAAALTVYKHATAAVPYSVRQSSPYHEALVVSYCGMAVSELQAVAACVQWGGAAQGSGAGRGPGLSGGGGAAAGEVSPSRTRVLLLQALQAYPHNPHLLALLLAHGRACRAAARLRRDLAALAAGLAAAAEGDGDAGEDGRSSSSEVGAPAPSTAAAAAASVWWVQLVVAADDEEQHNAAAAPPPAPTAGPPTISARHRLTKPSAAAAQSAQQQRLARLLERAAASAHVSSCPGLWLSYMSYEYGLGRLPYAKRVFLRAVREVPLANDVWVRGFQLLGCGGDCGDGDGGSGGQQRGQQPGVGGGSAQGDERAGTAVAVPGLLTSREVSELLGVAGDKGVRLRTDVYEVMLEYLGEENAVA